MNFCTSSQSKKMQKFCTKLHNKCTFYRGGGSIKEMYPTVSMSTLSKYRSKFLAGAQAPTGGRPSKVNTVTQKYIARMVRNGSLDDSPGVQKYLRSIDISMSLSGAEKLLKGMGFIARRKRKTNFVSAANKKLRLAWVRKHKHLTVSDWHQWVFSDETRANLWGLDSQSFYWSDVPGTNRPHQVQPQVQGNGDGVMFWSCISGDGPGYGTSIIDGTIDSNEYVEILKTSLMQTLEYYGKQVKVFIFSKVRLLRTSRISLKLGLVKTNFLYAKSLIGRPKTLT